MMLCHTPDNLQNAVVYRLKHQDFEGDKVEQEIVNNGDRMEASKMTCLAVNIVALYVILQ